MTKQSHLRSLAKAFSWRIFATLITVCISYIITHQIDFAIYIGLFEFASKIIFFYLHERIWEGGGMRLLYKAAHKSAVLWRRI